MVSPPAVGVDIIDRQCCNRCRNKTRSALGCSKQIQNVTRILSFKQNFVEVLFWKYPKITTKEIITIILSVFVCMYVCINVLWYRIGWLNALWQKVICQKSNSVRNLYACDAYKNLLLFSCFVLNDKEQFSGHWLPETLM